MSAVATSASVSREQVILNHLPQVKITAARFHRRCPPEVLLEDLVSAGTVGLLDAYRRFDTRRNLRFKTLAEHRIRGAILDYLRQLDPLPRAIRRFQRDRDAARARLAHDHQREPSEHDIARELGIAVERYRKLAAVAESRCVSLDAQCPDHAHPHDLPDPVAVQERECGVLSRTVEAVILDLPGTERAVVMAMRNGDSNRAIAEQLHVTEGRVSQIKSSALRHLRDRLGIRTPA
jgi:RNA polymerase sigma factor for flagellar operon FliA